MSASDAMVEKGARALHDSPGTINRGAAWNDRPDDYWRKDVFRRDARMVLEAAGVPAVVATLREVLDHQRLAPCIEENAEILTPCPVCTKARATLRSAEGEEGR